MLVNKTTISNVSNKPGIYFFKNNSGQILYVGKAKNLKKRLQTYFSKATNLTQDKQRMLEQATKIDFTITNSELEALLLESNLIKQFKPKYNIIFKDDKNYKYIKIDYQDNFPKIYCVRKIEKDHAVYFGPFTDSYAVNQTLNLMQKIFRFRDCAKRLNKNYVQQPCLKYHIKRCFAPCAGKISKIEYNKTIFQCKLFLKGKQRQILQNLTKQMKKLSLNTKFEQAAIIRDQIIDIKKILAKQKIISSKPENQDYISYYRNNYQFFINLFIVREGKLINKENFIFKIDSQTLPNEILNSFVKQYYKQTKNIPKEIIIQEKIDDQTLIKKWLNVKITIPQKGKKRQLLELGSFNAKNYQQQIKSSQKYLKCESALNQRSKSAPTRLLAHKRAGGFYQLLYKRIECYDISNLQGKSATGSMIVFNNGQPDKKEYRHFKIKTLNQPNDTAMIKEILSRRIHNAWPKPNLIIIDGGKSQLNAAQKILNKNNWPIPVISLAKRKEEIFTPQNPKPIILPAQSKTLLLLRHIRDEAHRFAISYHKKLRTKNSYQSILDNIKGIGPKYKKTLLIKFKTIKNIKSATEKELTKITNKKIMEILKAKL